MEDWKQIATEEKNRNTEKIDTLSTLEMVRLINEEDKKVAYAVERSLRASLRPSTSFRSSCGREGD